MTQARCQFRLLLFSDRMAVRDAANASAVRPSSMGMKPLPAVGRLMAPGWGDTSPQNPVDNTTTIFPRPSVRHRPDLLTLLVNSFTCQPANFTC